NQSVFSHTRDLFESVFGALYPSPTELLRGVWVGGGNNQCGIFRHRSDLAQGLASDQIYHQVGSVWRNGSYSLGGVVPGFDEGGAGGFHQLLLRSAGNTDHVELVHLADLGG